MTNSPANSSRAPSRQSPLSRTMSTPPDQDLAFSCDPERLPSSRSLPTLDPKGKGKRARAQSESEGGKKENVVVCLRLRPSSGTSNDEPEIWSFNRDLNRVTLAPSHPVLERRAGLGNGENGAAAPVFAASAATSGSAAPSATAVASKDGAAAKDSTEDGGVYDFRFDHLLLPPTPTSDLYEAKIAPTVRAAMEGYNGTVFAYGQTGSGKTYTMTGTEEEPGVIPAAIEQVFNHIHEDPSRIFLLRVSYLEIYNETIRDLLSPSAGTASAVQPQIREEKGRIYVRPLAEEVVTEPLQVMEAIQRGEKNRHVGATDWNERSSRSHCVFSMIIESRERVQKPGKSNADQYGKAGGEVRVSQLNLIDLAGSERAASQTERRKEGSHINKSLLSLATVISKLTETSKGSVKHIPYRDSKLTRLLQSSLSGNARIAVIITISPLAVHGLESVSTLKFGRQCKLVETKAKRSVILDDKALLEKYRREVETLKALLAQSGEVGEIDVEVHEGIGEEREKLEEIREKRAKAEEEYEAMLGQQKSLRQQISALTKLFLTSQEVEASRRRSGNSDAALQSVGVSPALKCGRKSLSHMGLSLGLGNNPVNSPARRVYSSSHGEGDSSPDIDVERREEELRKLQTELEVKKLQNELDTVRTQLREASGTADARHEELEQLRSELDELRKQLEAMRVQLTEACAARDAANQSVAESPNEAHAEHEGQLKSLQEELDTVRARLAEACTERDASRRSLEVSNAPNAEGEKELDRLRAQIAEASTARDAAQQSLAETEASASRREEELKKQHEGELKKLQSDHEEALKKPREELEMVQTKLTEAYAARDAAKSLEEEASTSDARHQKEVKEVQAELDAVRAELTAACASQAQKEEKMKELQAELEAIRSQHLEACAERDANRRSSEESSRDAAIRHEAELQKLRSDHEDELTKLREDHQAELENFRTDHQEALTQLRNENHDEVTLLRTGHEKELKKIQTDRDEDLKKLKTNHAAELNKFQSDSKAELKKVRDDHAEELSKLAVNHDEELNKLQNELGTVRGQLTEACAARNAIQNVLTARTNELTAKHGQVRELVAELAEVKEDLTAALDANEQAKAVVEKKESLLSELEGLFEEVTKARDAAVQKAKARAKERDEAVAVANQEREANRLLKLIIKSREPPGSTTKTPETTPAEKQTVAQHMEIVADLQQTIDEQKAAIRNLESALAKERTEHEGADGSRPTARSLESEIFKEREERENVDYPDTGGANLENDHIKEPENPTCTEVKSSLGSLSDLSKERSKTPVSSPLSRPAKSDLGKERSKTPVTSPLSELNRTHSRTNSLVDVASSPYHGRHLFNRTPASSVPSSPTKFGYTPGTPSSPYLGADKPVPLPIGPNMSFKDRRDRRKTIESDLQMLQASHSVNRTKTRLLSPEKPSTERNASPSVRNLHKVGTLRNREPAEPAARGRVR